MYCKDLIYRKACELSQIRKKIFNTIKLKLLVPKTKISPPPHINGTPHPNPLIVTPPIEDFGKLGDPMTPAT